MLTVFAGAAVVALDTALDTELLAAEEAADDDAALEAAALELAALVGAAALPELVAAADVDVVPPLLFELHAASAAPAASTEPTWKKRRRFRRDEIWDSSGWVMDGPFHLMRPWPTHWSASTTTERKPRTAHSLAGGVVTLRGRIVTDSLWPGSAAAERSGGDGCRPTAVQASESRAMVADARRATPPGRSGRTSDRNP